LHEIAQKLVPLIVVVIFCERPQNLSHLIKPR
jgi:hypothetical protein